MSISESLIRHCKDRYPREFAHPVRIKSPIQNDTHLTNTVERWQDKGQSCYISVYAFEDWRNRPQNAVIDRVYLDLDSETDPQIAIDDAVKLIEGLERYNIETTQYFSGKKGVAIYIDFEPVQIAPENKKETVAAFQHVLKRRFSLSTLDKAIIGDINRVSRLPNTSHQSSGLYCIPITIDELKEGIDHIRDLAGKPRTDLPVEVHNNAVMPDYMRRLEQQVIKDREKRKTIDKLNRLERAIQPHRHNSKSKDENIASKLIATLESTGYLSHKQRVGLVCLLDDLGWTYRNIVDLFLSNASDASVQNGNITRYQVKYTLDWKRRKNHSRVIDKQHSMEA